MESIRTRTRSSACHPWPTFDKGMNERTSERVLDAFLQEIRSRIVFGLVPTLESQMNTTYKIFTAKRFLKITDDPIIQYTSADDIIRVSGNEDRWDRPAILG